MLLQRVKNGANALSAREALRLATRGGAKVLRRDDVGQITVGKRADLVFWRKDELSDAGSWDAIAALVFCGSRQVKDVMIEGRWVVQDGHLLGADLPELIAQQNRLATSLIN